MIPSSPPARILVVEDEPKLAQLLADYLHAAGFEVECLDNGLTALDRLRAAPPDLMLLDLMLPGLDGLSLCRALRSFSSLPVIMLTARVEESDRLLGLEIGADDYICKPFSPREVVARVRTVLRRSQPAAAAPAAAIPADSQATPFMLDPDTLTASYHGHELELTRVEFRLLEVLVDSPRRVFSRDQLLGHVYDDHRVVSDRTVDSHIKNLRKKLAQVQPDADPIRSVYGVGYKFEP
ncbi:response regulator [Laribacter hongkongensis]|uniref:Response regulator n=1 Tax=Laribacter hongkongensis TaxID=168471 RepID=A0ABD4SQL0_9NEIS|nr:response regulator [Laribacter hongkongensis]MCG9025583.1 response regulator [Laribacter hongkongensis]MCG9066337.1 response regulator [Laribacter hongkongensis]MCG9077808.1 response regulator [Laribacter hongkongensis]MCG9079978.1 response regulator [Laribacter hongkongensis]MCG9101988.1 response regulator [Laribacter hongkongensis]